MKKYEYKFVKVPRKKGFGDTYKEVKRLIAAEAEQGWRLKQVVTPFNEAVNPYFPSCYQIIFEREVRED